MFWKVVLSVLAFLHGRHNHIGWEPISHAGPQTPEAAEQASKALHGNHEGGDILINEENRASGDGIRDVRFRWPGYPGKAIVPYYIDPSLNSIKSIILQAIAEYHKKVPCIQFVQWNSTHKDYLYIQYGNGCNSYVGRQGGGQVVNLGQGCNFVGTVIHELGHAIGFHHEHQRSDRDTYITVYENNVIPAYRFAVAKTNVTDEVQPFLTTYDYDSIMHYGNFAFSIDPGRLYSMVAKNNQRLIEPYDKTTFSTKDIQAIKKLYKC